MDPSVAVGAGGRVTSEAVNTLPTAVAVGKALTTVEEADDTEEEGDEEDEVTLLELEIFDDIETFLVDEVEDIFVGEEDDLTVLLTKPGVAVTALQTWETIGAGSATKGLPLRIGL
jgi:hypothetical protein